MRILVLIESAGHVCYRYRIAPFACALSEHGIELTVETVRRTTVARLLQWRRAARFDAVWLQRRLPAVWQAALLRRMARRLIFDFDDAIYQRDSYSEKKPQDPRRLSRFWALTQAADAIFAGNEYLARYTARFARPEQIHHFPTVVDMSCYTTAEHRLRGADARLAWIGQASTAPSLRLAAPSLTEVGRRLPGIQLRVIADTTVTIPSVRVQPISWSESTEAADLAASDIGISWLPDDTWSLGKCGLKVLQYMAAGLPVVANPVGMNSVLVRDGENGFLARTPREWTEAIVRLADNPDLRARMGRAGRDLVENEYSVRAWEGKLAETVARVIGAIDT